MNVRESSTTWGINSKGPNTNLAWHLEQHCDNKRFGSTKFTKKNKKLKISLPANFDGIGSQIRGFLNPSKFDGAWSSIWNASHLISNRCIMCRVWMRFYWLVQRLAWFVPLLEKTSPILDRVYEFIKGISSLFWRYEYYENNCQSDLKVKTRPNLVLCNMFLPSCM